MRTKPSSSTSGFTLIEILLVISIIAGLAAISSPIVLRQIARSRATQAVNNAKSIGVGLRDYALLHGSMPAPSGATSNESFLPLFREGFIVDEKPFSVIGVIVNGRTSVPGDEDITGNAALGDPANCVFTYWGISDSLGVDPISLSSFTPVLGVPVNATFVDNFKATTFQSTDFAGQAVVLFSDNSCRVLPIGSNGTIEVNEPLIINTTIAQGSFAVLPL
jgi:prepilin-type N-terminal cleavage/methylation domain-containing protein